MFQKPAHSSKPALLSASKRLMRAVRPFGPRTYGTVDEAIAVNPRPLICTKRKVVVNFSAKSGCTQVLLWFYVQEGLLEAAKAMNKWPHIYRRKGYYPSETYKQALNALVSEGPSQWTLIKVVRDPAPRMVSIFRHVVKTKLIHEVFNKKLGYDAAEEGLSLSEFGRVLERENLQSTSGLDMHLCEQYHPIWEVPFKDVITINLDRTDFDRAINEAAAKTGLAQVDFAEHPEFGHVRKSHHATDKTLSDEDLFNKKFRKPDVRRDFPKTQLLADPRVQDLARRLYAKDFEKLGDA